MQVYFSKADGSSGGEQEAPITIAAMAYRIEAAGVLSNPNYWHVAAEAAGAARFVDAWTVGSGAGVTISIVDEGINHAHADLVHAYDRTRDFDPRDGGTMDAAPDLSVQEHGTHVAGLVAGEVANDIGTVGGAQDSTITASFLRYGDAFDLADLQAVLAEQKQYDVSNNSWGFVGAFSDNFATSQFKSIAAAMASAAVEGRGGLGTVMVVSAGNGRLEIDGENVGDDANFHNFTNSRHAIAVGAHGVSGEAAHFSSPGANVLLTAPGVGLLTTDGLDEGSTGSTFVSGTSFSAPLVSSAVALMLAENPELGYRDVQEILAISSISRTGDGNVENGHGNYNGGGLMFSREGGFGLLDATAAVALARNWTKTSTAANEEVLSVEFDAPGLVAAETLSLTATLAREEDAADFALDWVEVELMIHDVDLEGLSVDLVSPQGTRVALAENFVAAGSRTFLNFTFSSVATWGESPFGDWRFEFSHEGEEPEFAIYEAQIRFYGDEATIDDTQYLTSSFAKLVAEDDARRLLSDGNGGVDTLNLAAGGEAAIVDLSRATSTVFQDIEILLEGTFENVVGTTFDDILTGSDLINELRGDFGNDKLFGGAGDDSLLGGDGGDLLDGGEGRDLLDGGLGSDLYNVDDTFDSIAEGVTGAEEDVDLIVSKANWYWDTHSVGEVLVVAEDAADPDGFGTTLVGSAFDNEMIGNSGTNVLFGRGGSDVYRAGDGVDFISLSTLGLDDGNAYAGVDGINTVVVEQRASGDFSYDIVFEFESGKDKVDVSDYADVDGLASGADVLACGVDDGLGNSYFILGDGLDYLVMVGLELADLSAADFIV